MPYWSLRVKFVLILNIAYFLTLFARKCLLILTEQKKGKKLQNRKFRPNLRKADTSK